jgi:hypothetical protein
MNEWGRRLLLTRLLVWRIQPAIKVAIDDSDDNDDDDDAITCFLS